MHNHLILIRYYHALLAESLSFAYVSTQGIRANQKGHREKTEESQRSAGYMGYICLRLMTTF